MAWLIKGAPQAKMHEKGALGVCVLVSTPKGISATRGIYNSFKTEVGQILRGKVEKRIIWHIFWNHLKNDRWTIPHCPLLNYCIRFWLFVSWIGEGPVRVCSIPFGARTPRIKGSRSGHCAAFVTRFLNELHHVFCSKLLVSLTFFQKILGNYLNSAK